MKAIKDGIQYQLDRLRVSTATAYPSVDTNGDEFVVGWDCIDVVNGVASIAGGCGGWDKWRCNATELLERLGGLDCIPQFSDGSDPNGDQVGALFEELEQRTLHPQS